MTVTNERRMSRRNLLRSSGLIGLGALGASLLAACGASSSGAAAAGGKMSTVTWLVRTGLVENNWEQHVATPDFQKAYPNIKVNLVIAPGGNQFDQKLFTLWAAGVPIDVWSHWGNAGFGEFVYRGMTADLTPYLNADHYDLTAFLPGVLDIYKRSGKYLAVPNDTTFGMPLYYNVGAFKQAGIEAPPTNWDQPWSWEQWVEAAKKMTKSYGEQGAHYGLTMSQDLQLLARLGGNNLFADEAAATGLAKPGSYRATTPETIAGVQAVHDLIYKEKIMPSPQLNSAITSGGVDPFRGQVVSMNLDGGWDYWSYKPQIHNFTWASASDPKLKTNRTTAYTDPWMLALQSHEPDAAWTFIKYLISEPAQDAYSAATGAPPCKMASVQKWWQEFTKPTGLSVAQLQEVTLGSLKDSMESYNHLLAFYGEIINAETQSLNNVWTGQVSPKDGLALAEERVNQVLSTIH